MQRAPWPVALVFGVSLAVLILLLGPLLLFNPAFTSLLQARHGVADAFGVPQAEVDRVTTELLVDIWTDGDFDARFFADAQPSDVPLLPPLSGPLLDESERSHMSDVAGFVRLLGAVVIGALVLAVVTGAWLRREPRRQGRAMLVAAGGIGLAGVVLALVFAVAFEPAFLAFHALFFPPGTYLFPPGSDLIKLFPGGFWFDSSLAAGGAVILAALVVSVVGYLRWQGGGRSGVGA